MCIYDFLTWKIFIFLLVFLFFSSLTVNLIGALNTSNLITYEYNINHTASPSRKKNTLSYHRTSAVCPYVHTYVCVWVRLKNRNVIITSGNDNCISRRRGQTSVCLQCAANSNILIDFSYNVIPVVVIIKYRCVLYYSCCTRTRVRRARHIACTENPFFQDRRRCFAWVGRV